jgi:3-hydroxyacyl-[acyl-carrier-protein] dehydratase
MSTRRAELTIAPDHPAFAGHFPAMPIVPGVVLLDLALHAIGAQAGMDLARCEISAVKFLSPLLPGEPACVCYDLQAGTGANMTLRLDIMSDERKLASGTLRVPAIRMSQEQ